MKINERRALLDHRANRPAGYDALLERSMPNDDGAIDEHIRDPCRRRRRLSVRRTIGNRRKPPR
jgi:hypothetical protein